MYRPKPENRITKNNYLVQEKRRQMRHKIKEHEQHAAECKFFNAQEKFRKIAEAQTKARENANFGDFHSKNINMQSRKNLKCYNNAACSSRFKLSSSSEDDNLEDNVVYNNYIYDNSESETESIFDPDEYTRKTLNDMETKMNAMTNRFVYRVKSEVDETFSKLRLQQKFKEKNNKKDPKKDEKTKGLDRKGAGDTAKHEQKYSNEDTTFSLLQKKKAQAYMNIEQNIKVLQQVDHLAGQLYKNHLSNLKKKD